MLALFKPGATAPPDHRPGRPADAQVSPLLAFIASGFSADIAILWPVPHTPFLTAAAARRHLVCLALARAGAADIAPGPAFVAAALDLPFKQALREMLPGAPEGTARALAHIGEQAWAAGDYLALLALLMRPTAAKVLRHAEAIEPRMVRAMASLPDEMINAGGEILRLGQAQTLLLAEAFEAVKRRDGAVRARVLAQRWAGARNAQALFRQAQADMHPVANEPAHPPAGRMVALSTQDAMADAARRYRNCLDSRFLDESNHYYEWRGKPGAVICVARDPLYGWRLDEAKAAGNMPVAAEAQEEIVRTLRGMGVHVGRSAWEMDYQLRGAADPDFQIQALDRAVTSVFGE